MLLSPHFSVAEFERSGWADRAGVPNRMPYDARVRAAALCANVLEPLRSALGRPLVVTSGYRSDPVNRAVGGAKNSQHRTGEAADVRAAGVTPAELFEAARWLRLPFDQLLLEFPPDGWVHVSHRAGGPQRGSVFVVRRSPRGHTIFLKPPPLRAPGLAPGVASA